jgi:hypothetical protein
MANKNKVWGQTKIRVNGLMLDTEGKSTLEMGGIAREAVMADHKAGFFSESTQPSKLTCNVLVTAGVSLSEMQGWDDVTATMEADTGQTYVINHGYVAEVLTVSEGKAQLVIQGPPAEEIA